MQKEEGNGGRERQERRNGREGKRREIRLKNSG
jgi:hypothetical protein